MRAFEINYEDLIVNLDKMINQLEFDAMRSPGKCKINVTTICELYALKDRYVKELAAAKKAAPKKAADPAAE